MITVVSFLHDSMHPWYPIFMLYGYCRKRVFVSIIALYIFFLVCFGCFILNITIFLVGSLFIWGRMPLIVLLNNSVAGLHKPELMGVDLICNRAGFISLLVSRHFLIVCFMSFMHTFTWPLLWWCRTFLWPALCSFVHKLSEFLM